MAEREKTAANTFETDSLETNALAEEPELLRELEDEDLALVLEDQKEETKEATNAVGKALLNDSETLTDEKALRVMRVGRALVAASEALAPRAEREE